MPDSAAQPLIQSAMQYVITIGLPAIVGLGLRIVWAASKANTTLDAVQKDIGEVKNDLSKLEEHFIEHLQSGHEYARHR